jgi:uncharacterized protein YndB with AHSA1/START domain
MNETTVTTPNALEIRVERVFDAPHAHVFSVLTDPQLIPEWWGETDTQSPVLRVADRHEELP